MRKSLVSLVWLAGPLSGLVTQPLVGVLSDRCTSKLGRRRPFIIGSTIAVIFCFGVIGWTREIAGDHPSLVMWLAVIAFYLLDFAINSIQASLRALIVDVLPTSRQDNGTAWASRMIGLGNVAGYLMGFLDLVQLLPFLGSSQLQVLTTLASFALGSTVAITCYFTCEKPISRPVAGEHSPSDLKALGAVFTSFGSLPTVIKRICWIQFFAWIGWFPFLFYGTTYVAGFYASNNKGRGWSEDELMERGTRAGSLAMFSQAVSSLVFSFVLPMFTYSAGSRASLQGSESRQGLRIIRKLRAMLSVSLSNMWTVSLATFSACMFGTFFTSTVNGATWLIGACGFSWALAIWAPFTMIGESISGGHSGPADAALPMHSSGGEHRYAPVDTGDIQMDTMSYNSRSPSENSPTRRISRSPHQTEQTTLSAGIILGIHNVFIVMPQFITAFLSSIVFAFFEHTQSPDSGADPGAQHAHQIALVLRLGSIASAVAAYYAWRLSH
ncbi:hypothetical protein GGI15_001048 [Coemansia interrupta]|uniref:Sucrose transporter n=1 Tax=Coemansia interrupta TaxID=1126814 RepID=A0A9W8HLZ2_9FUNG|nr:hypothetical protein GGI15_001048 [Coemansia interrupta]